MQEFFNQAKIAGHSIIVCGQCSPEKWDSLFEVKSFAQSIRGRLLEHSYRLELKGPEIKRSIIKRSTINRSIINRSTIIVA